MHREKGKISSSRQQDEDPRAIFIPVAAALMAVAIAIGAVVAASGDTQPPERRTVKLMETVSAAELARAAARNVETGNAALHFICKIPRVDDVSTGWNSWWDVHQCEQVSSHTLVRNTAGDGVQTLLSMPTKLSGGLNESLPFEGQ